MAELRGSIRGDALMATLNGLVAANGRVAAAADGAAPTRGAASTARAANIDVGRMIRLMG